MEKHIASHIELATVLAPIVASDVLEYITESLAEGPFELRWTESKKNGQRYICFVPHKGLAWWIPYTHNAWADLRQILYFETTDIVWECFEDVLLKKKKEN